MLKEEKAGLMMIVILFVIVLMAMPFIISVIIGDSENGEFIEAPDKAALYHEKDGGVRKLVVGKDGVRRIEKHHVEDEPAEKMK